MEYGGSYVRGDLGGFGPTLEDVASLTCLAMFRYASNITFEIIEIEVDEDIIEKPDQYQPLAQRWSNVKQNKNKKWSKVINIDSNFRPYIFTPRGITELQFYTDDGGTFILKVKDDGLMQNSSG